MSNFDSRQYIRCLLAEFAAKHTKAPLSLTTHWKIEPDFGSWQTPDISCSHLYRDTIAWTLPTVIYIESTLYLGIITLHEEIMTWKCFLHYWPFQGTQSKGPVMQAFDVFFDVSLNCWTNNQVACDLRCHNTHADGLVQGRCNSIANALDLRLPCTNPWMWCCCYVFCLSHHKFGWPVVSAGSSSSPPHPPPCSQAGISHAGCSEHAGTHRGSWWSNSEKRQMVYEVTLKW